MSDYRNAADYREKNEDDVEICITVFRYAVDCVLSEIRRIKKRHSCYDKRYVTELCNSHGLGFGVG